jgi:hypothetical protein
LYFLVFIFRKILSLPHQPDLTIFVNTSDNFEDCWNPFFALFAQYWPNCPYPIVLNTEKKGYNFESLDILCTRVSEDESERLTWSECLLRGLGTIKTPYILYLQEDYFLDAPVRSDTVEMLLNELRTDHADVIRLMESEGAGPWIGSESHLIWEVAQKAKYRISLQAALWRKDFLRAQVRSHENPWQLESFGSMRLRRKKAKIFCVNRKLFSGEGKEIFSYRPTGVIAGKWVLHIVQPLFLKHGIEVDYSQRGIYEVNKVKKRRNFFLRLLDRFKSFA